MKKKIVIKILIIFLLVILINSVSYSFTDFKSFVNGKGGQKVTEQINKGKKENPQSIQYSEGITDPTINPKAYKPKDNSYNNSVFKVKLGNILGAIRNIGVSVAVIILMVIGLKYILGSVEEKATYKQTLYPYLIGAIVLFMGSIIPTLIYNFVK